MHRAVRTESHQVALAIDEQVIVLHCDRRSVDARLRVPPTLRDARERDSDVRRAGGVHGHGLESGEFHRKIHLLTRRRLHTARRGANGSIGEAHVRATRRRFHAPWQEVLRGQSAHALERVDRFLVVTVARQFARQGHGAAVLLERLDLVRQSFFQDA